jgi:hypothetical protein
MKTRPAAHTGESVMYYSLSLRYRVLLLMPLRYRVAYGNKDYIPDLN